MSYLWSGDAPPRRHLPIKRLTAADIRRLVAASERQRRQPERRPAWRLGWAILLAGVMPVLMGLVIAVLIYSTQVGLR